MANVKRISRVLPDRLVKDSKSCIRNTLCRCGSGLKTKKCCGALAPMLIAKGINSKTGG